MAEKWTVTRRWYDVEADDPVKALLATHAVEGCDEARAEAHPRTVEFFEHDGYSPHPDLTPALTVSLQQLVAELGVCTRDHPEDERLSRCEANVRWLLGQRR